MTPYRTIKLSERKMCISTQYERKHLLFRKCYQNNQTAFQERIAFIKETDWKRISALWPFVKGYNRVIVVLYSLRFGVDGAWSEEL